MVRAKLSSSGRLSLDSADWTRITCGWEKEREREGGGEGGREGEGRGEEEKERQSLLTMQV